MNEESTHSAGARRTVRWVLPLAGVVVALGLGLWLRASRLPVTGGSHARPVESPGDWPVDTPPVLLPPATPIVAHGSDPSGATALFAALEPYRRDDFAMSATTLEGFIAAYPASPDGWFYLGASRLLSGDAARARQAFEKARALEAGERHPELDWLSATAEARTGAIASAQARLARLCAVPGPVQVRACAAKESLAADRR